MLEKSAAAVQTAPSRPPVKAGKTESESQHIERLREAISRRAFELFERDGRADGKDVRHWLEAERELLRPVALSVEETDGEILVRAEVSGFTASDLEVTVEPTRLTISGKRETRKEEKESETSYAQDYSEEIFRALELPSEVNTTKASATLKDGILEIQIAKAESRKSLPAEARTA